MFEEQQKQPQAQQPQPSSQPVPPAFPTSAPASSGRGKKILFLLLIIILLAAIVFGGYYAYQKFFVTSQKVDQVEPETEEQEQIIPATQPADQQEEKINGDTDRDGLTDKEEQALGTSISLIDTDDDGLTDFDEVKIYNTDPLLQDTDNDSYFDGEEVEAGYDPNGPGKLLNFELEKQNLQ